MEIIISEYSLNLAASPDMDYVKETRVLFSETTVSREKHGITLPSPALLSLQAGLLQWFQGAVQISAYQSLWEIKLKE